MGDVFVIAAAVAVVAWTIAREEIFREFRDHWCKPCIDSADLPWCVRKAAYMPTCEYCCSFWVTLLAVFVFPHPLVFEGFQGHLLSHLVTWAVAIGYMSVYQRVRVEIRHEQVEIDKSK